MLVALTAEDWSSFIRPDGLVSSRGIMSLGTLCRIYSRSIALELVPGMLG
jgi:hypothetical protein